MFYQTLGILFVVSSYASLYLSWRMHSRLASGDALKEQNKALLDAVRRLSVDKEVLHRRWSEVATENADLMAKKNK